MPMFTFGPTLAANALGTNPLVGWDYEFVPMAWPRGAAVSIRMNHTGAAGSVQATIKAGTTDILSRSPVQAGGTAGVLPSELNTSATVFRASPNDRLKILLDETAGATPVVNGTVEIEPL